MALDPRLRGGDDLREPRNEIEAPPARGHDLEEQRKQIETLPARG